MSVTSLSAVLALGDDAVAHVFERGVLGDVEPRPQAALRVAVDLAHQHLARLGELFGAAGFLSHLLRTEVEGNEGVNNNMARY